MPTERVDFANSRGQSLAALLELPEREPVATAVRPLLHLREGQSRGQAHRQGPGAIAVDARIPT